MMISVYQRREKIQGFAEIIEAAKSKNKEKKLSRKEKKKENLLRKKLKKDPDQYREKFGQCPRGYVWDEETEKCKLSDISKTEPEVKDKPPEQKPQKEKKTTEKPATEKTPESYRPPPTEPAKEKKPEEIRRDKRKEQEKKPATEPETEPVEEPVDSPTPPKKSKPSLEDDDYGFKDKPMTPEDYEKKKVKDKAKQEQEQKDTQERTDKWRKHLPTLPEAERRTVLDDIAAKDPKVYKNIADDMRERGEIPDNKTANRLLNLSGAQQRVAELKAKDPKDLSPGDQKILQDFDKALPTDPDEIAKMSRQWTEQKAHEDRVYRGTMQMMKDWEVEREKAVDEGKEPPVLDAFKLFSDAERMYGRPVLKDTDKKALDKISRNKVFEQIISPGRTFEPGSPQSKWQSWWQKLVKQLKPIGKSPWAKKGPEASVGSVVMKSKIVAVLDEVAVELDRRKSPAVASLVDATSTKLSAAFGDLTPSTFAPLNGKQVVCMLEHKSSPVLAAIHGKIEIEKNSFAFEIIGQGGNRMVFPWTKPSKASRDDEQYFLYYGDLVWRISLA